MSNLINFLEGIQYQIVVNKVSDGCSVLYPKNVFYGQNEDRVEIYTLTDDGFIRCDNLKTEHYKLPKYAVRLGITICIINEASKMMYMAGLIKFMDGDTEVDSVYDLIKFKKTKQERLLSKYLWKFISYDADSFYISSIRKRAARAGIVSAYDSLTSLVEF